MTRSTRVGAEPGGPGPADEQRRRLRIRAVVDRDRDRDGAGPAPITDRTDDGTAAGEAAGAPPRIVVADADPQVARTVAAVLGPSGAVVVGVASRASDVLDLAERLRPDLVLLEAGSPGGPPAGSPPAGLQVAGELHRRRLAPVVLLLPGDCDPGADQIGDCGAVGCLAKPLRSDALPPMVEMALARAAGLASLRDQVADITGRLRDRELLERAKGLLMLHRELSEPQAFRWLQRTAMDRRTPMATVAAAVVDRFAAAGRTGSAESGPDGRRPGLPAPVLPPRLRQGAQVRRTAVGQ